jgi:hypothetical protein
MSKKYKRDAPTPAPFKNEFEQNRDVAKWLRETGKPSNSIAPLSTQPYAYTAIPCNHRPHCVLKGDKWDISCGTGHSIRSKIGDFTLLLNCANGGSYVPKHIIPIKLKRDYNAKMNEIRLDWDDYSVPSLDVQFWYDLYEYIVANNAHVLVFCVGGHGRTGTAMASLLVASGYTAQESIKILRENYCQKAVESKLQEQYVHQVEEGRPAIEASVN